MEYISLALMVLGIGLILVGTIFGIILITSPKEETSFLSIRQEVSLELKENLDLAFESYSNGKIEDGNKYMNNTKTLLAILSIFT